MQGYFWNGEWMIPLYLLVLGVLQLLCVIWLFDIAKGVYAFVVSRAGAGNLTSRPHPERRYPRQRIIVVLIGRWVAMGRTGLLLPLTSPTFTMATHGYFS